MRRWDEAGRPDDEECLRALVIATIDAGARHLDPERLEDMKASIRLRREQPLAPSAYVGALELDKEEDA